MYNGIGLATVRGSGTNGYVTKNLSFVSKVRTAERKAQDKARERHEMAEPQRANPEIIDHNRKREIEVKVFQLRETLETQGLPDEEVDAKCDALRQSLLAKFKPTQAGSGSGRSGETHEDAMRKEAETARLKGALGVSSSYVGGSAFDQELQQRLKEERMAKRAAAEEAKLQAEADLEEERAREMRRREKAKRKEEKESKKREKKEAKRRENEEKEAKRRRLERERDRRSDSYSYSYSYSRSRSRSRSRR